MSVARRASTALALLLALTATALLAAGCGGGDLSEEEYGEQLRSTMAELEAAYGTAGSAIDPEGSGGGGGGTRSVGDVVEELRSTQVALRDAGNRLASIEPPTELGDEHDDLVAGVRDMADAVDLLIEAQEVAATNQRRAEQLAREFASDDSFDRVEAAAAALEEAGIDAGL